MLRTRVVTAVLMLAVLMAALFWLPPFGFSLFALGVAVVGGWEFARLVGRSAAGQWGFALLVALTCTVIGWWLPGTIGGTSPARWESSILQSTFILATIFWLLLCPLWLRHRWLIAQRSPWIGVAVGLVVLVPTWLAMLVLRQNGVWTLLGGMAIAWVADIAAYFVGRAFGKRKLAPEISPGKTVAGAYGAVAGVLLYGMAILAFSERPLSVLSFALVPAAILLTAVSIWGDLFESLLKRQAGIKDSSQLLPGHGGVMDRIDSLTAVLPVTALALMLL